MAQKRENREAFLKYAEEFRGKAGLIIIKMLELSEKTRNKVDEVKLLVEEILQSLFFLGKINTPPFTPKMILRDRENEVKELYPELFHGGSAQLPRRSPFSCVLDMIVCCVGEQNEEEIKTRLQEFILCVCLCPCDPPTRAQEISQNVFTQNAKIIIDVILESNHQTQGKSPALVNQILHSIFFLGHQTNPRCTPEMILGERRDEVCERYPRPFQRYWTEEPIPCVLNTIDRLIGQNNEERIKGGLQELILKLKKYTNKKFFLSSAVCISQVREDSVRYYGVSMSTFPGNAGPKARKIMIAASCLGYWHTYVAGAVMTYLPNKDKNIDGTIKLPVAVRCEAFSLTDGVKMSPCKSCATLFSLQTVDKCSYPYGNCAEAESLSKLLTKETQVRAELRAPGLWNDAAAREKIQVYLTGMLEEIRFDWDGKFYSPQIRM